MKQRLRLLGCAVVVAAAMGGCTATVAGDAYGPDLVYAAPGVQVIADYDEPVFYSDGFYWRYYGNTWYRSPRYNGGWAYATPPPAVLHIDRPYAYAHYRPSGWQGHAARPAPAPRAGWRGNYAANPPPQQPSAGWRGAPASAPQQPAGGWRGAAPPARPAAPSRVGTAPAPNRPAPRQQGRPQPKRDGWR